jgi:hypothetical protein
VHFFFGHVAEAEAKGHVIVNRHMGIKSVVLEDHRDIAVFRFHVVDQGIADEKLAGGDILETRDHAEGRGFAAAGGADKDNEFLVLDLHVEIADGFDAVWIHLVEMPQ